MSDKVSDISSKRHNAPVIVLAGFMGTGKTETGRELARLLGCGFLDTDELIERREGMKVAEIFRKKGEGYFRAAEERMCAELACRSGLVVATGGGVLLNETNRRALSTAGRLILLKASPDEIARRIGGAGGRPLLNAESALWPPTRVQEAARPRQEGPDKAGRADTCPPELERRIEALLRSREPAYGGVDTSMDTTGLSPREAACRIAASLEVPASTIEVRARERPGAAAAVGSAGPDVSDAGDGRRIDSAAAARYAPTKIEIGRGLLSKLGELLGRAGLRTKAFVLISRRVRTHFLDQIRASLDGTSQEWDEIPVRDGERAKNVRQVEAILDALASRSAERDSVAVAVGGGVTGDLAGFAASIYMRGMPLVHVPTTLLAQVDSSIGGKVGVNHSRAKNLIGGFHPPRLVVSDPCTLRTLPMKEISNGMAEVVKTAIIGSPQLFAFVEDELLAEGSGGRAGAPSPSRRGPPARKFRDVAFLERCVAECAAVKARIVAADPYERGERRVLNLGHTLGHALESECGYSGLTHGEAVSVGLVAALRISAMRGLIGDDILERSRRMLARCGLPTEAQGFDEDALRRALALDKKRASGRLRFVLAAGLGSTVVVDDVSESELVGALRGETR